ncbi:MAG: TonB-dependent receptor plug domain-containing protein [Steroidobacteraceae bacterium]
MAIRIGRTVGLLFALGLYACETLASADATGDSDIRALKKLSLQELLDMEVTSVSKRPEKLLEAPAAIQVLTGEDIRRSAATTIPSALRMANNLDVAQLNGHQWVISARGFSSDVGNKLLVLMDGRTLYTPLFSGVFWDRQDYVLGDIDRIEIISGPGGALWGANAVNGVINITTKSAQETQGLELEAGAGENPKSLSSLRYGGRLTSSAAYRVYGKYSDRDGEAFGDGTDATDSWHMAHGGFRIDTDRTSSDSFTLQGDVYGVDEGIISGGRSTTSGHNLLGRWSRTLSDQADMRLQIYWDHTHLTLPTAPVIFAPAGVLKDSLDTYDVDFQHHFQWGERQRIVWGLGYRFTHDVVENSPGIAFFPPKLDQSLYSGFLQDEIAVRDNLTLTLGTKIEHTDYTGFEIEPSVRMQIALNDTQSLWGAVSRAVRTPSRIDRDISQPAPGFLIVVLQGGASFKSEEVLAYELGYRAQLAARVNSSLSLFYNEYDDVRSTTISPPDPVFNLPFPFFFENNLEGSTYGFELNATIQLLDRWRLFAAYRLLQEDIRVKPGAMDFNNALNETSDPQQQMSLRSLVDLPHRIELDAGLRWIDQRRVNNVGVPAIVPDYIDLDLRLGWHATDAIELSIAGQNLLNPRHPEYGVASPTRVEIERCVFGKVLWRF